MPRTPDLCLVTGGTGAVGPAVIRELREQGLRVRVLARHPAPSGVLPDDVETRQGDITDAVSVRDAAMGARWILHLAALLHRGRRDAASEEEYRRVNVDGTRLVMDAALRAGSERVVFFSTIAVYGGGRGLVLTEDTDLRPETAYARSKHEAEAIVRGATRAGGQPLAVILRLAAVYGPHMRGNYARLLSALATRRFVPIGRGENRRTLVFDADAARAAVLAAMHPRAAGRTYNVTGEQPHTMREILRAMSAALGRRPPRLALPEGLVRGGAALVDGVTALAGRQTAYAAALETYLEDVAVDGSRMREELGFTPDYNLRVGWASTVRRRESAAGVRG